MYIPYAHKITLSVDQNLKKKVPKVFSQQIRKRYCKTLGASVINSQMSPPLLYKRTFIFIFYLLGTAPKKVITKRTI